MKTSKWILLFTLFAALLDSAAASDPRQGLASHSIPSPILKRFGVLNGKAPAWDWSWSNPTPDGDRFVALAYGDGIVVAAGIDGVLYTSTDEIHWAPVSSGLVGGEFGDILYADGMFVATGSGADGTLHFVTSRDGKAWKDHQTAFDSDYPVLAYGDGTFVAVGRAIYTSQDGTSWTEHAAPADSFVSSPVFANGVFVVQRMDLAGVNSLYYSTDDGVTWQASSGPTMTGSVGFQLASNGTTFVALIWDYAGCGGPISVSEGRAYSSTDGQTWTNHGCTGRSEGFESTVVVKGTQFVTSSCDPSLVCTVYTSDDGSAWSAGTGPYTPPYAYAWLHSTLWIGDRFLMVGDTPLTVYQSSDFSDWSTLFSGAQGPIAKFDDVIQASGRYIAVGSDAGSAYIMESRDGARWTSVYTGSGSGELTSIAYGNGMFVAVGDHDAVTSRDGIHWTEASVPPDHALQDIAYGGGSFMAVGADLVLLPDVHMVGAVETSPDGQNWTYRDTQAVSTNSFRSVAYAFGRFFVMTDNSTGDGKSVLSSSDGSTWGTPAYTMPANSWTTSHLRVLNNRLVDAGFSFVTGPFVIRSADGAHWSSSYTPDLVNEITDIGSDGLHYYAFMGSWGAGEVLTSLDLTHWSTMGGMPYGADAEAVSVTKKTIVCVGSNGSIVTAESKKH